MAQILVAEDEAALRGHILRALAADGHDAVAVGCVDPLYEPSHLDDRLAHALHLFGEPVSLGRNPRQLGAPAFDGL
ncbi:MAG TPA: hypothetical protein VGN21_19880, partial [Stellaceae bacterium]